MTPLDSWHDLQEGQVFAFGVLSMSEAEIIEYAERYDPQPFHTDPLAARDSPLFGGLVASGLHTMAVCFGRIMGGGLFARISLGGSRIDTRWPNALRPDEAFALEGVVEAIQGHRSRQGIGVLNIGYTGRRMADNATVITMAATQFLKE